jgi:hypothetical protein
MLFDVDLVDMRDCASDGVYGGGAMYVVRGEGGEVAFWVEDMVMDVNVILMLESCW